MFAIVHQASGFLVAFEIGERAQYVTPDRIEWASQFHSSQEAIRRLQQSYLNKETHICQNLGSTNAKPLTTFGVLSGPDHDDLF
jgi:hypothetical protein